MLPSNKRNSGKSFIRSIRRTFPRLKSAPGRRVICAAGILALVGPVKAAVVTWDGGAAPGNVNWTSGVNWAGDIAPLTGDSLVFDGAAGLSNTNDFVAGTQFN